MKITKSIILSLLGILMVLFACEPIEKRDLLVNSFNPDQIELEVVQSTPGGNQLSMYMKTPGIAGYWDYILDTKFSDRVDTIITPIKGLQTLTFYISTPYMPNGNPAEVQYIAKTVDVQVDNIDHPISPLYYALVGENLEGKTWIFDGVGGDGGFWWYMVNPGNWQEAWWNAAGTCCPPSDATGRMKFDLSGKPNFTYYANPGATAVTGSLWAFNSNFTKITIKGTANILGSESQGGNSGVFEIKELSAEKMILFVPNAAGGTGWVWVFKPEPVGK